jgi:hypothetical protein
MDSNKIKLRLLNFKSQVMKVKKSSTEYYCYSGNKSSFSFFSSSLGLLKF